MSNDLAISILSYNHPEITRRCVQSALQHYSPNQIYLCHNGSQSKFVSQLEVDFPNIQHCKLNENRGYSGGANFILSEVFKKYRWCFFLTNDCQLLTAPGAPPKEGLYSPTIFARKMERIDSLGGYFIPSLGKLGHLKGKSNLNSILPQFFYTPGTAFYLDRDTFSLSGGFDERLGTYWEDVDFSLRVQRLGLKNCTHLSTQVLHGIGKTCHKDPQYTSYLYQRNRKKISWKYTPILLRPILITTLVKSWLHLAVKNLPRHRHHHQSLLIKAIKD